MFTLGFLNSVVRSLYSTVAGSLCTAIGSLMLVSNQGMEPHMSKDCAWEGIVILAPYDMLFGLGIIFDGATLTPQ